MARRQYQQKGNLYRDGNGWRIRWRENAINEQGKPIRIRPSAVVGPCTGPGALTEKQAMREAYELVLKHINRQTLFPQSIITLREFVARHFLPEHVALKKLAGRIHYDTMLKHILPSLGDRRMRDITLADLQRFVVGKLSEQYYIGKCAGVCRIGEPGGTQPGSTPGRQHQFTGRAGTYSVQTCQHLKNALSAIFEHAKRVRMFSGENPARQVRLPEMERRELHALTWEQIQALLEELIYPARELALFAVLTSMNIAELCGLQWKRVNLTGDWITVDGETIPPMSIAVRRQWYRGKYGTVKAKPRNRNLPISPLMARELEAIRQVSGFCGPDDPVFGSSTGTPADEHNLAARKLKPAGRKLGMPWLSWHCFRRTHTTLADQIGMTAGDRMAMNGHATLRMTERYTIVDLERRREIVERMAQRILTPRTSERVM